MNLQCSSMNKKTLKDLERRRLEEVRLRKIIQDAEQKKYKDSQQLEQLHQSEQQLKMMYNELLVKFNETAEELKLIKMSFLLTTSSLNNPLTS